MTINTLLNILQLQIIQIILVAYIGALLGEMKKEVEDNEEIMMMKFLVSWLGSGFGGVMVGLLLQGTVASDNNYVIMGASGLAGFAGQQKSVGLATKILSALVDNAETLNTPNKKTTRKKTTKK